MIVRGFADVLEGLGGLESRMANHVMAIMRAMANEAKEGPRLCTIEPSDRDWKRLTTKQYRLRLWCEAEDCQHPVLVKDKGVYEFEQTRKWVRRVAPYANFVAGVLKTVAPLALPAANVFFSTAKIDEFGIKNHLDLVKEGTRSLLSGKVEVSGRSRLRDGLLTEPERSGVLALHALIRDLDPTHTNLGLHRVPTLTGDFLWLCNEHYEATRSKIPDPIEF